MSFTTIYKSIKADKTKIKVGSDTYQKALDEWERRKGEFVRIPKEEFSENATDYTNYAVRHTTRPSDTHFYIPVVVKVKQKAYTHDELMKLTGRQMINLNITMIDLMKSSCLKVMMFGQPTWMSLGQAVNHGLCKTTIKKVTRAW